MRHSSKVCEPLVVRRTKKDEPLQSYINSVKESLTREFGFEFSSKEN